MQCTGGPLATASAPCSHCGLAVAMDEQKSEAALELSSPASMPAPQESLAPEVAVAASSSEFDRTGETEKLEQHGDVDSATATAEHGSLPGSSGQPSASSSAGEGRRRQPMTEDELQVLKALLVSAKLTSPITPPAAKPSTSSASGGSTEGPLAPGEVAVPMAPAEVQGHVWKTPGLQPTLDVAAGSPPGHSGEVGIASAAKVRLKPTAKWGPPQLNLSSEAERQASDENAARILESGNRLIREIFEQRSMSPVDWVAAGGTLEQLEAAGIDWLALLG